MTNAQPATAHHASSPWALPWADKKAVLIRAWKEGGEDNVGLVAAGVAFYGFLAIVPLLGALVLSYGIFADPHSVVATVERLTEVMPADAAQLVGEQLSNLVDGSDGKKGLGLLAALAVALFGARNGAGAIITALNIAYEEQEKRNFIVLNLTALAITAGAVLVALVAIVAVTALGALDEVLGGQPVLAFAGQLLSYLLFLLVAAAGAATLYRFGPSRAQPRWQWITPGSLFTAVGWLLLTLGFGVYVSKFGNYNATYGSLGAVVVLLTWLYLSSYLLLLGAELNSEFEHQVAGDTTTGAAQPTGQRGAWVADHVAGRPQPPERSGPGSATSSAPRPTPVRAGTVVSAGATGLAVLLRRRWTGLALLALTARLASRGEAARPGQTKERT
jgi:membrane protein